MPACQCACYESMFDERVAEADLRRYRRKGPVPTTRRLVDALRAGGVSGQSLLDIGGGVGVIQHELIEAGVGHVAQVDAAQAYLSVARAEAERRGYVERAAYLHGDFVALASEVEPADIVTLDRVICCYADFEALIAASASRARRTYGIVIPRNAWWVRLGNVGSNLVQRLRRGAFRSFIHPVDAIDAAIRRQGLTRRYSRRTLVWEVWVYAR